MTWYGSIFSREQSTMLGASAKGGCFVAVVGPSGAGKDSLIRAMKARFSDDPRIIFARRIITRAADATEDNETVSHDAFLDMRERGAFFLAWSANGLSYGLPATLHDHLARGSIVVANISREILPKLGTITPSSCVVHVTADADILSRRLSMRGREDSCAREARLARSMAIDAHVKADVVIDNSGDIAQSQKVFEQVLRSLMFPVPLGY